MRFQVTAEDISLGVKGNAWECPVARAIRRKSTPELRSCVRVDYSEAGVSTLVLFEAKGSQPRRGLVLPGCVDIFARRFDAGLPVEPFEFDLAGPWDVVPEPVEELEMELVGV